MQGFGLLRKRRVLAILAVTGGALLLASCTRANETIVHQLAALRSPTASTAKKSGKSIAELKREVARYQNEVNRVYESTRKLGRAYEMLALKYFDNKMYGPALRSFKEAIQIYPTNPVLSYMAGLCEGQLAKAEANPATRSSMYERTANYYEHALAMNGSYKQALFALAVVQIFELSKPKAAEPHLKKLLSLSPHDTKAQFLLARVYASEGKPQAAAGLYDKIISGSATSEEKARARENKNKVLEGAYGK